MNDFFKMYIYMYSSCNKQLLLITAKLKNIYMYAYNSKKKFRTENERWPSSEKENQEIMKVKQISRQIGSMHKYVTIHWFE